MAASPFDTLRIAQALKAAGFNHAQSEAIVSPTQQSISGELATKSDLAELRADIYRALWIQSGGLVMIITAMTVIAIAFS